MKYITNKQYLQIKDIPRGRLAARTLIYTGVIIGKENKVLLCTSNKTKYPGWQLPGGKVLWSESILDCTKREVLEEVGLNVKPEHLIGVFQRDTGPDDEEYIRVIFSSKSFRKKSNYLTDPNIKDVQWFDIKGILEGKVELQSKQIFKEIERYSQGKRYPLEVLDIYEWQVYFLTLISITNILSYRYL